MSREVFIASYLVTVLALCQVAGLIAICRAINTLRDAVLTIAARVPEDVQ